jgi:hypothetical protein
LGLFCGNIELMCKPTAPGVTLGAASFTRAIETDQNGSFTACKRPQSGCSTEVGVSCGDQGVMTGIRCTDGVCGRPELQCRPLTTGRLENCRWTGWISSQKRWNVFSAGLVANGAQCDGVACSNMKYFVCDVKP